MKKALMAFALLVVIHGAVLAEQVPSTTDKSRTQFNLSAGYFGYSNVLVPNPLVVTLINNNFQLQPFNYQLTISGNYNGQQESVSWRVSMPQIVSMGLYTNSNGSKTYKASHISVSIQEECTNAAGHQTQTVNTVLDTIQLSTKNDPPYPNANQITQRIFNPCGGHSDLANHIMNNQAVLQQVGNGFNPVIPAPVRPTTTTAE